MVLFLPIQGDFKKFRERLVVPRKVMIFKVGTQWRLGCFRTFGKVLLTFQGFVWFSEAFQSGFQGVSGKFQEPFRSAPGEF